MKRSQIAAGVTGIAVLFLAGLGLLLYPLISQWLSEVNQTIAIRSLNTLVERFTEEEKVRYIQEAEDYNAKLWDFFREMGMDQTADEALLSELNQEYDGLLDPEKNGIMGIIRIPELSIDLPVYHGTEEEVLSRGAGHLQNTSLPVGGISTHSVISAHTGFPRAAMFDRLTEMKNGDRFYVKTMERTLVYRVIQIRIASPHDLTGLMIQEDKDLCTLVTCYPYGINSHRLLVTGEREFLAEEEIITDLPEQTEVLPIWIWSIPFGLLLTAGVSWGLYRRKHKLKWRKPYIGG